MGDSQRIQVPAFITAFVIIPMVLKDIYLCHIEYGWYHIVGKAFFFLACLGLGLYARYRVKGSAPGLLVAIVLIVILNCAHSLSYEPSFHSGYNATLLLALFVYNKSIRGFIAILVFSFILLLITLFGSGVEPGPNYLRDWRTNVMLDHFFISLIIYLIFRGIVKQMQERELLYGQFLDIGRKTSMIVHDLKGGLSAPLLYADLLKNRVSDAKGQEMLSKLKENLQFLSMYSNELHDFTNKTDSKEKEFFRLSDLVRSLATLAANEFSTIKIVLKEDYELFLNKNLLRRVLMNAFLNSAEASADGQGRMAVSVNIAGDRILIQDDGPGFPEDVLKSVSKGRSVTTKKQGSGLGCRIISEYVKLMGGTVKFSNNKQGGACVEIQLPGVRMEKVDGPPLEILDAPF